MGELQSASFWLEILFASIVVGISLSVVAYLRVRLAWLDRVIFVLLAGVATWLVVIGWRQLPMMVGFVVWSAIVLGIVVNLFNGFTLTSQRFDARHSAERYPKAWGREMAEMASAGWLHLGTWTVTMGHDWRWLVICERPADGTRVTMLGTWPSSGLIEVESLLNDGRGLLTTVSRRSWSLRPPIQFKQELKGASIDDLLRAHDDALYLLSTEGVRVARIEHDDPVEFVRAELRLMRRFYKRRWWLVAVRQPVIVLLPSRRRPLHEQEDFARQVKKYKKAIQADLRLVGN